MLRRLPAAVKRALRRAQKRRRRLRKELARSSRCVKAAAVTMSNAESPQCTDEDVSDVPASTMQTGPDALQDWVSILRKCDLLLPIAIGQGYVPSPVSRPCKPALTSTQHPMFEGISLERL